MANVNTAGFGMRQNMTVGSTPATGGQSEFSVQSLSTLPNAMYKGDPVGYQTTAGAHGATVGFIQDITFNETMTPLQVLRGLLHLHHMLV